MTSNYKRRTLACKALGIAAFYTSLGVPMPNVTADNGDDHQGAALAFGKVGFGDSADNWFHSDLILAKDNDQGPVKRKEVQCVAAGSQATVLDDKPY
ncbi:MAG: hypothetical protein V3U79_03060 [Dehalococcoidia bacterium]